MALVAKSLDSPRQPTSSASPPGLLRQLEQCQYPAELGDGGLVMDASRVLVALSWRDPDLLDYVLARPSTGTRLR